MRVYPALNSLRNLSSLALAGLLSLAGAVYSVFAGPYEPTSTAQSAQVKILYLDPELDFKRTSEKQKKWILANSEKNFARSPQDYQTQYFYFLTDRSKNGRQHSMALAKKLIKENPKWFSPLFYLAMEARVELDDEEQLVLLNKCLTVEPEFYGGYVTRSKLLRSMGREKEALADLNRAIELHPGNKAFLRGDRARIYFNLKEYDKCIADALPGIARFSGDANTLTVIRCYRAKQDWRGMSAFLDKYKDLDKTSPGSYARAEVLYANAQFEKALAQCTRCIALTEPNKNGVTDPKLLTDAVSLRAKVYRKLGMSKEAAADEKRVKREVYDDTLFLTR